MEKLFPEILKAALEDRAWEGETLTPTQWESLLDLARLQDVLPMIWQAVYRQPGAESLTGVRQAVRQQVMLQTVKTEEFCRLYRYLEAQGIPCMVVKGIVCRSLYPRPDQRRSSDEDLVVREGHFEAACKALEEYGMTCQGADPEERSYRMAGSPLHIELHGHLFPPDSEAYGKWNALFSGCWERTVDMEYSGTRIRSLGHTDHLLYLLCHGYKHFLHSGFGLRQVSDLALYANAWGPEILWEEVLEKCRAIRGEYFAGTLFAIGRKYLTFDPVKACYPENWKALEADEKPLLEDLLAGGVYGGATESRKHSSNMTLAAVTEEKGSALAQIFPKAQKLEGRYPYLKRHSWLLPVAWSQRLWQYATRLGRDNLPGEAIKIGSRRIELLKTYHIID